MNILLDQNISFRVVSLISSVFEHVKQVRELKLTDANDVDIWKYARLHNYTIVTFDNDFIDLANLKGSPPKIIWLRFGNSSNLKIAHKLISNATEIHRFVNEEPDLDFLEID
ncbi:DUF5615 family PIN-like protein [Mucilaginibacter mali]|uniref:DUF5615 family PIN-like protein n=1 Tax=Mucilaginibacter mali TaxID=2740462 RepID=A0A7D4Q838_9SPHI|nr:DUF5615 family PIN-like protein [Mucilaginibacter mali]QKJ30471.1 DUF5615 family PIN-like protein [Mucilaginibacter mali]